MPLMVCNLAASSMSLFPVPDWHQQTGVPGRPAGYIFVLIGPC